MAEAATSSSGDLDQGQEPQQKQQPPLTTAAAMLAAEEGFKPGSGTASPGTVTPALSEGAPLDPEQAEYSLRISLADLSARGTALYAHKNYDDAAEIFAQAAEMQAEMNGEMAPANAEILFLYGRSLFRVGQSKSDVLGGRAPEQQKKKREKKAAAAAKRSAAAKPTNGENRPEASAAPGAEAQEQPLDAEKAVAEGITAIVEEVSGVKKTEASVDAKKPLFQFTGDENWDDSDGEEAGEGEAEGEEDEDEDEDELAMAFEILDLARVLFNKRLDEIKPADEEGKGKEKATAAAGEISPEVRHIKERLADTHDLLAEISLENERYPNAIVDSRESLRLKKDLYPEESEVIAEAHFKLSLALEFASVTTSGDDEGEGEKQAAPKPIDQELRDEAAQELEAAIASTKLKLQSKEVELATLHSPDDNKATRKVITEVKDLIADMEQRLVDLRKPPIDVNAALSGVGGSAMGGLLGASLGESAAQTEARVEAAKKSAHDLTGLVRKKNKDETAGAAAAPARVLAPAAAAETNVNGKRKAEEPPAGIDATEETKKARIEDA